MRTQFVAAIVGLCLAGGVFAQEKGAPPNKKPEPTLKAGDKAPALKADKWLQGTAVPSFEAGKVYVVEFWATWCGPCITMMPHLADLAEEYADKGVTVIGFSSTAQDKLDKAEKFVAKRGPKLGYRFAWGDDDSTHKGWMNAAGQGGIPCSFVVDKEGKIAFIGHPMFLDGVLPLVVAGKFDIAKGAAESEAIDKDFEKAYRAGQNKDPMAALKAFEEVLASRPSLADNPYLLGPKLELYIKNKRFDDARKSGEKVVAKAIRRGDTNALRTIRAAFLGDMAKNDKGLVGLAVKASELDREVTGNDDAGATIRLASAYSTAGEASKAKKLAAEGIVLAEKALTGEKDWQGQLLLASAYDTAGDKAGAKSAAEKAIAAAGNSEGLKQYVAQQAKKYGAEPKKPDESEKKDK